MSAQVRAFFANTTPAGRCLVGIAWALPVLLWQWLHYAGVSYTGGHWPGMDLANVSLMAHATEISIAVQALVGMWLWPRRHSPSPQFPAQLLTGLAITGVYTIYVIMLGAFTTGLSMAVIGLLAIGLLLFDQRVVGICFVLALLVETGNDLLVLAGRIPYAPALTPDVMQADEPVAWWKYWRNSLFFISFAAWVGIIFWLLERLDAQGSELESLSRRDGLTGIANRRHFMERLAVETQRRQRYERAFCVVLCDADHFKRINDSYGHHSGDDVLREVAHILADSLRTPGDLAARLGGEEFALLLPETTREQAVAVCERVSRRLRQHEFVVGDRRFRVTLSMGVVECVHLAGEEALKCADINLYAAKSRGRDRIVSSSDARVTVSAATGVPA
ncbi:MAG TPA: GGDEF domain-containing protein [Moraxellaceae bacterium]|nr:GGDEF domain-containing protein [Moraxellaceae bacterium]